MPSLLEHLGGSVVTIDMPLVQSIFKRINFVKRKGTKSTKAEVKNAEEEVSTLIPFQLIERFSVGATLQGCCATTLQRPVSVRKTVCNVALNFAPRCALFL